VILASLSTLPTNGGFALAIGTVAALVLVAVLFADLVLLAIGAVGTLIVLPSAVSYWFPGSSSAPLALLGVGLALVGIAVWTTRRRRRQSD
jgi:LPXTG-motif cell wall-anchored protein